MSCSYCGEWQESVGVERTISPPVHHPECEARRDDALLKDQTLARAWDLYYDLELRAWRDAACGHARLGEPDDPVVAGCRDCDLYGEARAAFLAAVREQNAADAREGFHYPKSPVGYEAACRSCDQSFNPADEDDLIHLVTVTEARDGGPREVYCGGRGEMAGAWYSVAPDGYPGSTTR